MILARSMFSVRCWLCLGLFLCLLLGLIPLANAKSTKVLVDHGNRAQVLDEPKALRLTILDNNVSVERSALLLAQQWQNHQWVLVKDRTFKSWQTPLGSVWKLFVYSYLEKYPKYQKLFSCRGRNLREEVYCCQAGEVIDAPRALIQSCGLYFDPARLGISPVLWREFWLQAWKTNYPQLPPPDWLIDLKQLQAQRYVLVSELLFALQSIPNELRLADMRTLNAVVFEEKTGNALQVFGSGLKIKTWSWDSVDKLSKKLVKHGGFAGWTQAGQAIWVQAEGTSANVLAKQSGVIEAGLSQLVAVNKSLNLKVPLFDKARMCVDVNFFARYPIKQIYQDSKPLFIDKVNHKALHGHYQIAFENGQSIAIESLGEMYASKLETKQGTKRQEIHLTGRYALDDYVARVVAREAGHEPLEAARALSIAARTYVLQNAKQQGACLVINDSSQTQRVLPRPVPLQIKAIANFTQDMLINQPGVLYRLNKPNASDIDAKKSWLVWQDAVLQAQQGKKFDEILRLAYPGRSVVNLWQQSDMTCGRVKSAETWLAKQIPLWRKKLNAEVGFEMPEIPQVCRQRQAHPAADNDRNWIYGTEPTTQEARIALAHEFLHLAFANHPKGFDEAFIEAMARKLILE